MALPCPSERVTAVTAKMDDEIKQLERRTIELTEEIERHQSPGSRKPSRRMQTYRFGVTGGDTGGRQGAGDERRILVEEGQQSVAQGRKWQRSVEVAETLVGLDNKIKDCLAKIDRERDRLEQLQHEVALLHDEQREMTIETGGTTSVLLSEKSRNMNRALLELRSVRALRERPIRRMGGWSDCESD